MTIFCETTDYRAGLPTRATDGAAGFDLVAIEDTSIYEFGEAPCPISVRTGIKLQIPEGWVGLIRDRSGMAKNGIFIVAGVIDSDFRGEVKVLMYNSAGTYKIRAGDRIAQIVFVPCYTDLIYFGDVDKTERGEQGFGSTGQ